MTPVKLFSSSNVLPCSVFDNIADVKLISTLRSGKSALYRLIIQSFFNLPSIPRIRSAERICGIGGNFLTWRFFSFLYWSLKGTALICQITNNECLRGNATKMSQFLSILVSRDPCCYLSSKKLAWINCLSFCRLRASFNSVKK